MIRGLVFRTGMSQLNQEKVLSVHHWNDTLFSFTTTRNQGFRFRNGHFVMLGLEVEGRPLLRAHELVGDQVKSQLLYYPTVTREAFRNQGRINELVETGKLSSDLGLPGLDPQHDRVMLCGSPSMLRDLVGLLEARGFAEGH